MNSNPNYNDWTREQKEEFAKQRMLLMKSKNAKLMQRHAEVEQDRIEAEKLNSAITGIPKVISKREKSDYKLESNETEKKTQYVREWDRGKSDIEYWDPPEYYSSYKNYKSSHFERKSDRNDNLHNYSRTENKHGGASEGFKNRSRRENYNYKNYDHSQHKNTCSSYYHIGPKTARDNVYQNNESRWKSQKTIAEEKYRKGDYKRSFSKRSLNKTRSHSYNSDSDSANLSNAKRPEKTSLWHNAKLTEDQNKLEVVERWVTCVNKSNNWNQLGIPQQKIITSENKAYNSNQAVIPPPKIITPEKSYSKFDRFERSSDHSDDDDISSGNSNSFMHENKLVVSSNRVIHENDEKWKTSAHKSLPYTNEQGYVKKHDKYSSEVHLGGCNKNENFRKQKRFENKGIKNDFEEKLTGNKFKESKSVTDKYWNNSELPKDGKLGFCSDSNYCKSAAYNANDDGLWGSAEQSNIKWKLSDDESQDYVQIKKIIPPKDELGGKVCSEKFLQRSKMVKPNDEKNQIDSDGGWSTVSEEGEIRDTEVQARRKKKYSSNFVK